MFLSCLPGSFGWGERKPCVGIPLVVFKFTSSKKVQMFLFWLWCGLYIYKGIYCNHINVN